MANKAKTFSQWGCIKNSFFISKHSKLGELMGELIPNPMLEILDIEASYVLLNALFQS